MFLQRFQPQSLKTRVTLLTLLIVVLSFLSLASYMKGLLREELLRFTGEQQRSALNLLTAEVNHGLQDRLDILKTVASRVSPTQVDDQAAMNAFLLERPFLAGLFNSGAMIWNRQGVLQANMQFLKDGLVANALDPQELATVLKDGEAVIGRIHFHSKPNAPAFAMAVPIRNLQGEVIGALAGVIRLDQANFLSQLASHRYGKTGNFFLLDARQRLIFATSDTPRLMEVLPAPGISPWIDRFVQGFEGTARVVNPHGVEVLVSIRQIPLAHWYASVTLAPEETFALIEAIQPRGRLAALVLALFCLTLIWLMLRRQLAPMTAAVNTLDGFVRHNQPPQALPVVRQDEIGQLVGGFNRLLDTLAQQKKVLQDSEIFKQAVLNSVTAEIAVLDRNGVILTVNDAWRRCSQACAAELGQSASSTEVGANYLAACQSVEADPAASGTLSAQDGIQAVLDGRSPRFYLEYTCHSSQQQRWFSMSVTPLQGEALQGAVVSLEDISERIQMEKQVRDLAFYDPLTHLPNRRLALERLTQQLVRARRAQTRLALLFIDLDKFKPINDALGHEVGDWVLHAVAQRIQACLRESDTAARLGGDEFVVLLPDLQTSDAALAVAEKIRAALAQDFVTTQGLVLSISSSIGVALYPDHGETEKDLLRLGDEAMYRAKKSGCNAVQLCVKTLSAPAPEACDPAPKSHVHLRWKAAFASGNPVIDQEHETLFRLANTLLDEAALRRQQPAAFEAAFEALLAHVVEHFAHEEAILLAHGFAGMADHARQHQVLLARAHALHLSALAADAGDATEGELVKFLVTELVAGHMLHTDSAFFPLFATPGVQTLAAPKFSGI
ncbi:diguanylate cyclase [Rhodoferax ferrireducens]|uniref:diguanylate cyclase domain-containing protein n=1 Tax=Rhodoferax ferrireducens TaxID=192843 RepID=UPI00298D695D|nr:diguanylate cyclase [Rhodoferax ferrireducens]WPC66412.1 diguanylate cyclase [Rhodoferax ferrireducens]